MGLLPEVGEHPRPDSRNAPQSPQPSPSQIEELVAGSNNGRSPQLASYYFFWEQAVFNALAVMLLRGLERLHAMLGPAARQPLFRVGGRGVGHRGSPSVRAMPSSSLLLLLQVQICVTCARCSERLSLLQATPSNATGEDLPAERRGGGAAPREGDHQAADQLHQERGRELQVGGRRQQ